MNPSKQEITALITPVTAEVQGEARALASEGREAKALSRLHKASGPGLLEARAALAVLDPGRTLPVDYPGRGRTCGHSPLTWPPK
ncbi:hypothetical protein [Streptomyces sp. HUAS TT7]|uniref:hypothetical protein n=1 Tax=Streptomyces sp. HUAS TT7 TaxID=3447507 RepID=UPI003F65C445